MTCYLAIGSTYTADGWTPEGPLFSVLVPADDQHHAIDYARRYAVHGPNGLAMHGAEDVRRVEPMSAKGRRPRNTAKTLPIYLPTAPDRSRWQIVNVKWEYVTLQRLPHVGESKPEPTRLTWAELRGASADHHWYRDVLRRCEAASY